VQANNAIGREPRMLDQIGVLADAAQLHAGAVGLSDDAEPVHV
jgi:hypothetical protein